MKDRCQDRRTRRTRVRVLLGYGVVAIALVGAAGVAHVVSGRGTEHPLDDTAIARMSPAAQSALLQPLRRLADDLDTVGRAVHTKGYAGVELDAPARTVELFATSATAGRRIVTASEQSDRSAAWGRVRIRSAVYPRARLEAAAERLVATERPTTLRSVSIPADGSALHVDVDRPDGITATLSRDLGVAVDVRAEAPDAAKSWADVKWHDHAPFIGGDLLTANGHGFCSAGLPTIRTSTGQPVLVTAAHCFTVGQRVYTGAGTTGAFGNGQVGSYVGTVTARTTEWDAETLVGSDNNADESDTTGWKPLTSVAYSYDGDYVCQDGVASYFLNHGTPCGIKVTDDDIWFPIGGYWARGVEGIDYANGWGSHNGDSGGTVFATEPGNVRQARGIVSSGGADGTPDQRRVDWTEAVDIFRTYGLRLNPRT